MSLNIKFIRYYHLGKSTSTRLLKITFSYTNNDFDILKVQSKTCLYIKLTRIFAFHRINIIGTLFVILIFFFFKMLTRYAAATSTISTKGTAATGLHFCQQPTPRATTGRLSHRPAKAQGGTGSQWSHFSFYQTIGTFFTTICPTRHFLHSDSHSIVP